LRTDDGEVDARFTNRDLVENFIQVALYDEYISTGGALVAKPTKSRLRRWEGPIRLGVTFGDRVPDAQRENDMDTVRGVARRFCRCHG